MLCIFRALILGLYCGNTSPTARWILWHRHLLLWLFAFLIIAIHASSEKNTSFDASPPRTPATALNLRADIFLFHSAVYLHCARHWWRRISLQNFRVLFAVTFTPFADVLHMDTGCWTENNCMTRRRETSHSWAELVWWAAAGVMLVDVEHRRLC